MADDLSELRNLWLIARIITMDCDEIADGNVRLGMPHGRGTFEPRRDCQPLPFTTAKSLVIEIEAMQIETVNWLICDKPGENCPLRLHFHFTSPN
jgi:hypothetical protein